jgi:hypothetical protein
LGISAGTDQLKVPELSIDEAIAIPSVAVVRAPHCKRRLTVPEVLGDHSSVLVLPAVKEAPEMGWMKAFGVDAAAARAAKRQVVRAKKRIFAKVTRQKVIANAGRERRNECGLQVCVCNKD